MSSEPFNELYFDFAATTPLDSRVYESMRPWMGTQFGNTLSNHTWGWDADRACEKARTQVSQFLNAPKDWIFFTSGATEGNNWVLQGLTSQALDIDKKEKIHIISSPTEHSSVLKTLQHLQKIGRAEVSWAEVNRYGFVDPAQVKKLITPHTQLMSFMWVNNELGGVNPVHELGALAHEHKIYFHTDATQAVGKVKIDLQNTPVDLLSFSSHKIYGPQGIGVLVIRGSHPKVEIPPFMFGGGHERSWRSGTLNVSGIVGTGAACELLNIDVEVPRYENLRQFFLAELQSKLGPRKFILNTPEENRIPHVINISFPDGKIPSVMPGKVALSRGSACLSTGQMAISAVLKAVGVNTDVAQKTLRISLGRPTTKESLVKLADLIASFHM